MLKNQLKVLLQRVYNGGREPSKILLSSGMREALRLEMHGSVSYTVGTFPKEDSFHGVTIVVVKGVDNPLVQLKPLADEKKSANGLILPKKF